MSLGVQVEQEWLRLVGGGGTRSKSATRWADAVRKHADAVYRFIDQNEWENAKASLEGLRSARGLSETGTFSGYPAVQYGVFMRSLSSTYDPDEAVEVAELLELYAQRAPAFMRDDSAIRSILSGLRESPPRLDLSELASANAVIGSYASRQNTIHEIREYVGMYPYRIVESELDFVRLRAANIVRENVIDRYADILFPIWNTLLESDEERRGLFRELDGMGWGGHPDFRDAYSRFSSRSSSEFFTLWADQVLSKARSTFAVPSAFRALIERIGKTRTYDLFPVRNKHELRIVQSLAISSEQVVLLTEDTSTGREWVLKYASDVEEEAANYQKLSESGGATPLFDSTFDVLGLPVLVIEKLTPLDADDDEYEIVSQILTTQLPFLHRHGVHSDIKPDNIMKRTDDVTGRPVYFLIDHDWSTDEYGDGFRRRLYTPLFAYQSSSSENIMTWWHDVLELIFAGNAIMRLRQRRNRVGPWAPDGRILKLYFSNATSRATPEDAAWIESGDLPDPQSFLRSIHSEDRNNRTRYGVVDKLLKDIALTTGTGRAQRLINAATRLYELPVAHPAPAGAYEELARIVQTPTINDRRGYAPGDMPLPRVAAPLLLESLSCESCGRRNHQLRRGLFRTTGDSASPPRVVCGTRCRARIPSVKDSEISPIVGRLVYVVGTSIASPHDKVCVREAAVDSRKVQVCRGTPSVPICAHLLNKETLVYWLTQGKSRRLCYECP